MKTETLIKVIIFGSFFCLVILIFCVSIPFYKYLPPILPAEKCTVTEMNLSRFCDGLTKVVLSAEKKNAKKILDKILNNKKDPWGTEYWYKTVKWETNDLSIKIVFGSSGPDKIQNTKDDLTQLYSF